MSISEYLVLASEKIALFSSYSRLQQLALITGTNESALTELIQLLKTYPEDINKTDAVGSNILMISCEHLEYVSIDCITVLLEHGSDPNQCHEMYGNSLNIVVTFADEEYLLPCIKLLVKYGCDINMNTVYESALYVLIERDVLDCAKYLIDIGADSDLVDSMDRTCLMQMCKSSEINNMTRTILSMLARFSDVLICDVFGKTAYEYYVENPVLCNLLDERVAMLKGEFIKQTKSARNII